jgi:hypothetical protein
VSKEIKGVYDQTVEKLQRWLHGAKGLLKDWEEEAAQKGKHALTPPAFDIWPM